MAKRDEQPPEQNPEAPFNEAFASLRDRLPEGFQGERTAPASPPAKKVPSRAVVRIERKGRGGKEATVVEKLDLSLKDLLFLADLLKRSLGCGGGVENDRIVLQGDQRERVAKWLLDRGVRKVVRG